MVETVDVERRLEKEFGLITCLRALRFINAHCLNVSPLGRYYYLHFTSEETKKLDKLPRYTQLGSNRAEI